MVVAENGWMGEKEGERRSGIEGVRDEKEGKRSGREGGSR